MKFLANIFSVVGEFLANSTASGFSWWSYMEEEEMPESLM